MSQLLDIKEGTLETLLVYLSLEGFVKLLPSGFASASVSIVQQKSPIIESDLCIRTALQMCAANGGGSNPRLMEVDLAQLSGQLE